MSIAVMAVTLLPYLFGFYLTGANRQFGWFSWLGYNLDDGTVYLSWIRQAADGAFFQRNLFTTEPQPSGQFNVFFLLLGGLARFTGLSPIAVWHLARVLLGLALLLAVFRMLVRLLPDDRSRRFAFLLVCFSSGAGWLPGLWQDFGQNAPADVWQPEAITFLSLYLNPLFIISQLLMVGFLSGLIDAERTGSIRPAISAAICGLFLGNIHGYDVITLTAIWGLFLAVRALQSRASVPRMIVQAAIAFLPAMLSAGYQYYLLKTNPVFAARVNVETLSPPITQYVLGYGLLVPLAIFGMWSTARRRAEGDQAAGAGRYQHAPTLMFCWVAATLVAAYLPVPFQRKLIMGLHLPLSFLAGAGMGLSFPGARRWAAGLLILGSAATNVRFLARDVAFFQSDIAQSVIQRPYLMAGERRALEWLRVHARPVSAVQPLPWVPVGGEGKLDTTVAAFAPELSGLPVAVGHWGETPAFGDALRDWSRFSAGLPAEEARALLSRTGVRYIVFSQKLEPARRIPQEYTNSPAPLLRIIPEASNADAEVYEVLVP